jgi:hypothetical protein
MANLFIKSFLCPHCRTNSSFIGIGRGNSIVLYCIGCEKGVFFKLPDNWDFDGKYEGTIPIESANIIDFYPRLIPEIDPAVPKEVADDYAEAIKCHNIAAYKATVTQCRRAMQNSCVLNGANSKLDLIYQIDELESKRIINPTLKDIAHAIRMIGNWGAHPQSDPLREVTPDDASEVLKFTSEFLDEVFIRPSRIKSLKAKKGMK